MWRCCIWDWDQRRTRCATSRRRRRSSPTSAAAHFNLGTALAQAGRLDEAVKAFRDALARRPDYALAHNNLGRVLLVKGEVPRGVEALSGSGAPRPENPQNLLGLSEACAARRIRCQAIEMLDRALRLPMTDALAPRFARSAKSTSDRSR